MCRDTGCHDWTVGLRECLNQTRWVCGEDDGHELGHGRALCRYPFRALRHSPQIHCEIVECSHDR